MEHIDEAIQFATAFPELIGTGIYHANKALIYTKQGLLIDAQLFCKHADKAAHQSKDPDGLARAKCCSEQIEKAKSRKYFYFF